MDTSYSTACSDAEEVAALRADVERVFDEYPPDERGDTPEQAAPFRYEMLNRSGLVQRAVGHPRILEVVEPLLGEDCHVIANTAWWQPSGNNDHLGRFWHIDSGPHVPRDPSVPWDTRIPYPVFAIATHLYLWDCPIEAGPTGVIPGSHTSGQAPPMRQGRPTTTSSGTAAAPFPSWPRQVTLPSSSRTSGTGGCRPAPGIRAGCSSSATTGVAISPNESGLHPRSTISPPKRWHGPGRRGRGRSPASTRSGSTTAEAGGSRSAVAPSSRSTGGQRCEGLDGDPARCRRGFARPSSCTETTAAS